MVKEDDHDTVMVYMTETRHGRHFTRITTRSSNPIQGEELDNTSKGYETPVTDEEAPLINKNTEGIASPMLQAIDDNVSLTTRSLERNFSPHTGPRRYSIFKARKLALQ